MLGWLLVPLRCMCCVMYHPLSLYVSVFLVSKCAGICHLTYLFLWLCLPLLHCVVASIYRSHRLSFAVINRVRLS